MIRNNHHDTATTSVDVRSHTKILPQHTAIPICDDTSRTAWNKNTTNSNNSDNRIHAVDDNTKNDSISHCETTIFASSSQNYYRQLPNMVTRNLSIRKFPTTTLQPTATATTAAAAGLTAGQMMTFPEKEVEANVETSTSSSLQTTRLVCGLMAGIVQAGVFNPYDRALYLSIQENRSFLHSANWINPYSGFLQSISGRALQGGLYFPFEHFFLDILSSSTSSSTTTMLGNHNFIAGTAAGALNAIVLNPLSAIKYKTWGRTAAGGNTAIQNRVGMLYVANGMLQKSGFSIRPFFNGLQSTLYRDIMFGGIYTYLRLQIPIYMETMNGAEQKNNQQQQHEYQFVCNIIAASFATIASAPFNYVRNVQYGTKSTERALSSGHILQNLRQEMNATTLIGGGRTILQKLHFLQIKLRIGWGTARVALGISLAHTIYDTLYQRLK